eukprot:TRINITY_DN3559_c2_g1_i1.p1 TRINITY_DN3559_c2_g1~~TRINITY_DN3559_c2_g1_i1.p1  ORF type:complete len:245 (+),score=111.54 TRINITY_DN3559_c2_g1_i1:3-737(+)
MIANFIKQNKITELLLIQLIEQHAPLFCDIFMGFNYWKKIKIQKLNNNNNIDNCSNQKFNTIDYKLYEKHIQQSTNNFDEICEFDDNKFKNPENLFEKFMHEEEDEDFNDDNKNDEDEDEEDFNDEEIQNDTINDTINDILQSKFIKDQTPNDLFKTNDNSTNFDNNFSQKIEQQIKSKIPNIQNSLDGLNDNSTNVDDNHKGEDYFDPDDIINEIEYDNFFKVAIGIMYKRLKAFESKTEIEQ